jgi:hypothetical protein
MIESILALYSCTHCKDGFDESGSMAVNCAFTEIAELKITDSVKSFLIFG